MDIDVLSNAETLFIHGKLEEAYTLFSTHSNEENPRVMFLMGAYLSYYNKNNVTDKHDSALYWYKKGSSMGDILCKYCETQYIQSDEKKMLQLAICLAYYCK